MENENCIYYNVFPKTRKNSNLVIISKCTCPKTNNKICLQIGSDKRHNKTPMLPRSSIMPH